MPGHKCLAAGSLVRTPAGDVRVEDIAIGSNIVVLRDGIETVEAVKWVGYRQIDLTRHARPELAAPVRIRTGAIAEGQPSCDLFVSPEHALYIDAVLVETRSLINGGSIAQDRATDSVIYYHIELATHGVFFANDLAVESYLDNGDRSFFESDDQPIMLHPALDSFDARTTSAAYAPFITEPAALKPIWARVAQRSQDIGFACPALVTTPDADVHLVADGKVIRPGSAAGGRYVFALPASVHSVALASRFAIPTDAVAYAADSRRLGIAVTSISVQCQGEDMVIPADFPMEQPGWYDVEQSGSTLWRWTDGIATLPIGQLKSAAIVTIAAHGHDAYPIYDDRVSPARKAA